ncbi:MAG: ribonucleotide-diphosphate reductase subunit beta [Lachnospiraceae bacterium]|jgi:ribonucleoside-diphosphate reductase beta chain|nr:ribonucleotide-diphosphate reductase subunit beta [Lachnospiraceae bacterium]
MSIFDKRENYKPFEYPQFDELKNKLRHTYWTDSEITLTADKLDYFTLSEKDREIIKRTLVLIAIIEVKVKDFWGQLGNHFPKPEISNIGATASESEVRHSDSYDKLLTMLNFQEFYSEALKNEAIRGRFGYLDKYLKLSSNNSDNKQYILKLILFSILIENVSLFSQFATLMYFYRYDGIMKDIRNIVKWTSIDESLHFNIGVEIIKVIRAEFPEIFEDGSLEHLVHNACKKSVTHESRLLDWVFEKGELPQMSKENLIQYMKYRIDDSLTSLGFTKLYNIEFPNELKFYHEEVYADSQDDFFAVRPVDYTLKDTSIKGDDLF